MRIISAIVFFFLLACNEGNEAPSVTSEVHPNAKPTIDTSAYIIRLEGCYEMTSKNDTTKLALIVRDSMVSGKLIHHWHQRDQNEGRFAGVIRGDLIVGDYLFKTDTVSTIREMIFSIRDSTLLPAMGELVEKNGRLIYLNREDLEFNTVAPFYKVPCNEN